MTESEAMKLARDALTACVTHNESLGEVTFLLRGMAAVDALNAVTKQARAAVAAIDALAQQPMAAPSGWRLIPIEPTQAMMDAAVAECHRMRGVIDPVAHVWDAMIAAAPLPPGG